MSVVKQKAIRKTVSTPLTGKMPRFVNGEQISKEYRHLASKLCEGEFHHVQLYVSTNCFRVERVQAKPFNPFAYCGSDALLYLLLRHLHQGIPLVEMLSVVC